MPIKLYNTLTRKKEAFKPIKKGHIHMYVCGPTVYDLSHLGHARSYVAFDVIRRYFEYTGHKVTYVSNFTDVDDKIINRARELEEDPTHLANRFADEFLRDMDILGIKRSDYYPRVTEVMPEIIEFVKALIKNGFAYELEGDVYYRVAKHKNYGELSHQNLDEIQAGARVEVDARKEAPEDFALWKSAKLGELNWDSPWGKGRPGWHIECSTMSTKYLGETLDIHGGGQDLIFPHHTNEIAQSEGRTGKKFSNYWMHNGFVTIDKEKMSKSLKNFFTVQEILEKYEPEVVRFFLLSTHYRSPIDFSDSHLKEATTSLQRIRTAIENVEHAAKAGKKEKLSKDDKVVLKEIEAQKKEFLAAMDDDFNTREALAAIFQLVGASNRYIESKGTNGEVLRAFLEIFSELGSILNLFQPKVMEADAETIQGLVKLVEDLDAAKELKSKTFDDLLALLVKLRNRAREGKDYATSDRIRDRLMELHITLEDTSSGTKWNLTSGL